MYWYISFLRPPPVSTPISPVSGERGHITITPQIANDLRTELRYEPTDIYYIWQRTSPTFCPALPEELLTRWSPPESTYRPITIPLPSQAKLGESWRIGLFSGPIPSTSSSTITSSQSSSSSSIPASDLLIYSGDNPDILGVWSEGITLIRGDSPTTGPVRGISNSGAQKGKQTDKGKQADRGSKKGRKDEEGAKQGRIVREWTVGDQSRLRIVEQTSFDLDKKIWDSGLALSSWFLRYMKQPHTDPLAGRVLDILRKGKQSKLRLLELGSGTGLVSIALALVLEQLEDDLRETEITATDLDSAIELMRENISMNDLNSIRSDPQISVDARTLDWDGPLPEWITPDTWPDLVIAADVTYNTSSFPALLSTLTALLNPPHLRSGGAPMLLLAYKQRDPGERDLWIMLKDKGLDMTLVDKIQGSEADGKVEIWVGRRS